MAGRGAVSSVVSTAATVRRRGEECLHVVLTWPARRLGLPGRQAQWDTGAGISTTEHICTILHLQIQATPDTSLGTTRKDLQGGGKYFGMCFEIGIVTCGPNEALVISGMCQVITCNC